MNDLFLAIKNQLTTEIPSLSGRIFFGYAAEKTSLSGGAYAVVSFVADTPQFAFDDLDGFDRVQLQVAVFDKQLASADALASQVQQSLHGQQLTLAGGEVVAGQRVQRGVLALPPSELPAGDATSIKRAFSAFCVFEWVVTLS